MYKKKNMRGGNSTSHSAEYFGGDSKSYFSTPPIAGSSAYGDIVPVSNGVIRGNVAGPNLAVYPGGGQIQTGGNGCTASARRPQNGGARGCGYRPQSGGARGCGYRPQSGGARGCPYRSRKQRGGKHCGSHKKRKRPSRKRKPTPKKRPSNKTRSKKRHHVARR